MEQLQVNAVLPEMHPTLRELLEVSARRKWMSYEELNTTLPDEMVDPEKIDELGIPALIKEIEADEDPPALRSLEGVR